MKYLSLFWFLLLGSALLAQENKKEQSELEVLKKKIRQSTYYDSTAVFRNGARAIQLARKQNSLSEEGVIYQYYGNFYYFSKDYVKARKYYKKTLEIATRANDRKLHNSTRLRLAFMLTENDVLAAEKEFNVLLEEAIKNKFNENIIEAYNGLGIIYEERQIHDEAMSYYLKALKVAEKNKFIYHQAIILNNTGLIKLYNKQTKEARSDFEKALGFAQKGEESRLALNLHNNLGLVNTELKDFNESIKHYKETLQNAKKLGFPIARAVAYINLGSSYHETHDEINAMKYTDSAIHMFTRYEESDFLGRSYLLKAMIYKDQGEILKAKAAVDSVLAIHERVPSIFNYINSFDILSAIYEKEGKFGKALEYAKRFNVLSDSLSDISNQDKLAELQVVYGKERVEAELENEKSKNSLLAKENELKKTRLRLILILSFSVVIAGLSIIYIRYVRLTRKQQVLFSQKLIENIDEERGRISKDLHDDIGQSLSVIKSKINMFNTGKIQDVGGLDLELGEVINQTRNISHHLHPSFLEKIGLSRSLASLMERTQESTGIICSLELYKQIENLSLETKTQIYRIVQECINNTIKHAGATALKVAVTEQDGGLILKYKDNGVGMKEPLNVQEGIGIMTIRERGNKINGKTTFVSSPMGFRLILKF